MEGLIENQMLEMTISLFQVTQLGDSLVMMCPMECYRYIYYITSFTEDRLSVKSGHTSEYTRIDGWCMNGGINIISNDLQQQKKTKE